MKTMIVQDYGGMEGMEIRRLNAQILETGIKTGICLIDFSAPWCGPCRLQKPALEQLAKQYVGTVMFAEVNVDENRQTAMKYGIMTIPTIILLRAGKEIKRFVGLQPANVLSVAIEKALK